MILFRNIDIGPILNSDINDEFSLYSIIKTIHPDLISNIESIIRSVTQTAAINGNLKMDSQRMYRHVDFTSTFEKVAELPESFWDRRICDEIEQKFPFAQKLFNGLSNGKCDTSSEFVLYLENTSDRIRNFFIRTDLAKPLLESYSNIDTAKLLCQTGALISPDLITKRLMSTREIMDLFMEKNHVFAIALTLNVMHYIRFLSYHSSVTGRPYYNQGSVLHTLLTLSSMIVPDNVLKDPNTEDSPWYFFWRVFGSLLGLSPKLLPRTHNEALQLMDLLASSELSSTSSNERERLVTEFRKCTHKYR